MLDESAAFNPITAYGNSKVLVEQDVAKLASDHFSPTFMRNATAYGLSPRLRADIVGEQYPGLADKPQGAVRQFDYTARDQYPLFGYLTIPPGAAEKNLPLVVLPHGGPESDDEPYFDWWSQFLAARGPARCVHDSAT